MTERYRIALSGIVFFLLLGICLGAWSEEDKITTLQKQISTLEEQKAQLEAEGVKLIAEGDKLSLKIDALKVQAKGGLGIIGRYKLSRNLRKAQALSEEIQSLEKQIHRIEGEIKDKKGELEGEYDHQIALLLGKLNEDSQTEERGEILEKLKEYQAAKEQLKEQEGEELERLDITKIEIQEYDGPQEIREKADLINDFATKLQNRIDMLNARAEKLAVELKTRERLGEFAEEISFFGERISREEVVSDAGKEDAGKEVVSDAGKDATDQPPEAGVDRPVESEAILANGAEKDMPARGMDAAKPIETEPPTETEPPEMMETRPSEAPGRIVLERNGVSASFAVVSLDQIRREIELLEKQGQDLKRELAVLKEKAGSFYEKAEEIEKSETKKGVEKGKEK